jgi:hypothetical protein
LAVGIAEREVFWTPVYGRAQLTVLIAYASDTGDISWRDGPPSEVRGGQDLAVRIRGDIRVADATRGFIARPAYLQHLGKAIADEIYARLREALDRAAQSG